jgi:hypothetical protein
LSSNFYSGTYAGISPTYPWLPTVDPLPTRASVIVRDGSLPGKWVLDMAALESLQHVSYTSTIDDYGNLTDPSFRGRTFTATESVWGSDDDLPLKLVRQGTNARKQLTDGSFQSEYGGVNSGSLNERLCVSENQTEYTGLAASFAREEVLEHMESFCRNHLSSVLGPYAWLTNGPKPDGYPQSGKVSEEPNISNDKKISLIISLDHERCDAPFALNGVLEGTTDEEKIGHCVETFKSVMDGVSKTALHKEDNYTNCFSAT